MGVAIENVDLLFKSFVSKGLTSTVSGSYQWVSPVIIVHVALIEDHDYNIKLCLTIHTYNTRSSSIL